MVPYGVPVICFKKPWEPQKLNCCRIPYGTYLTYRTDILISYSFVRSLGTGSTGTRNGSNGTTPEISPPATTSKTRPETVERTVKDRVVRQRIYDVIDSEEENIVEEDDDDDDDDFEPSKVGCAG